MQNPFTHAGFSALTIYRAVTVLLIFLLVWLVWLSPQQGSFYARLQGLVYDGLMPRVLPENDPRVVIVDIDEHSLSTVGRWPWPREVVAELIARLRLSQAAVIGVDVLFPEPSEITADAALSRQLSQPDVVAPVTFGMENVPWNNVLAGHEFTEDSNRDIKALAVWPLATLKVGLAQTLSAAAVGHITPLYDSDHVIRRIHPVICMDDECYSMLALRMLESWTGQPLEYMTSGGAARLCVGSFCLALNTDNTLSIPYHHPSRFRQLSASEVLAEDGMHPELLGALVLIGTSAVGLGDQVATPLSVTTPGVEIHAKVLAAALDNFVWAQLPLSQALLTALIVSVLVLVMLWPGSGALLKTATCTWLVCLLMFSLLLPGYGYWLHPAPLWGALFVAVLLVAIWQGVVLLRQRRQMYRAFASYVPHEVIKTLLRKNLRPEQLDAQRVEVTVLFADIRGFTAISERLEPEQLVDLTNHLFTAINEEVHRHRGTLDKYMGDAVMAFWGAPLPQSDHALLALQCADAIQHRLKSMGDWLSRRAYPDIHMTIGMESGPVAVGNFGSRQRRAYTIMGKTVNLAAHLQPMCTELGVDILCGPELCRRFPDRLRILGSMNVRGIEQAQLVGCPGGIS